MGRQIYVQQTIACSHATLPVVCVAAFLMWFFSPSDIFAVSEEPFMSADYGFWHLLPSYVRMGMGGKLAGLALCSLSIYAMAELNNASVLLRVSSRMLSSMLAVLLATFVVPCIAHPGVFVVLFSLLSFFPLFGSCQVSSPMLTFVTHLFLSLASLAFPKLLCLVPVYWMMQVMMRSLSFRCFVASLLGVLLPYWFFAGVAVSFGWTDVFLAHILSLITFQFGDYAQVDAKQYASFAFVLLLFVLGSVDFVRSSFKDKTRVRLIYNSLIIHGLFAALFGMLQPQHMAIWQSVLIIDAAIVFGHFFTLTNNRFTNILMLVLLAGNVALMIWNH